VVSGRNTKFRRPVSFEIFQGVTSKAAAAETAALPHQTYNMPSLFIKGPDALIICRRN